MSGETDAILEGLMRVAPGLVVQLIERLHGADPQTREEMIADMRHRVSEMRAKIDAEIDAKFGEADTLPAPTDD